MAWKAVLFDMDGVLIDSEEYMAKTGVRALKKYGIDAKESDFAEFVGCGENRYVGGVAEKYGVPYRTEMKDYLYACYGEHVKEEANIPDGVLDVLHALRTRGYRLAVCSSADRIKVLMNLSAIGAEESLFDQLVTGTDIIRQCRGRLQGDLLAVPEVMVRDEKGQFLDDITLEQLGRELGCRAISIPTDGGGCCKAYLSSHKRKIKLKR